MNLPLRDLFNLSDPRGSDGNFRTRNATATAAFVDYANLGVREGKLWKLCPIISTFSFFLWCYPPLTNIWHSFLAQKVKIIKKERSGEWGCARSQVSLRRIFIKLPAKRRSYLAKTAKVHPEVQILRTEIFPLKANVEPLSIQESISLDDKIDPELTVFRSLRLNTLLVIPLCL